MINLSQLLAGYIDYETLVLPDIDVSAISLDARLVEEGGVFFALQGSKDHGLTYMEQAVKKGASVVVYEDNDNAKEIITRTKHHNSLLIPVKNLSRHVSAIAARFYGNPSSLITVIAITGTNGKTSCCFYLAQLLEELGFRVGVIGTLGVGRLGSLNDVGLTTPDAINMQRYLADFVKMGLGYVVMEASSHALDQYRLDAVEVDVAAFTNLTQDHLDYHGSMDNYLLAKKRLFSFSKLSSVILNADDDSAKEILSTLSSDVNVSVFSTSLSTNQIKEFFGEYCLGVYKSIATLSETKLFLEHKGKTYLAKTHLIGDFNIANLLLVLQVLISLGFGLGGLAQKISKIKAPNGRLERIDNRNGPLVFVDYAHTPDALEKTLSVITQLKEARLIVVFGCGGDRDRGKRSLMGKVAERLSDFVVLTNDNPRAESPQRIIDDILQGITAKDRVAVIANRKEAIIYGIEKANENDVVLIAGKGHEEYQIIGNERISFSDQVTARQALKEWRSAA